MTIVIQKIALNSSSTRGPCAEKSYGSHQSCHVAADAGPARVSRAVTKMAKPASGHRKRVNKSSNSRGKESKRGGWCFVHHPPLKSRAILKSRPAIERGVSARAAYLPAAADAIAWALL